MFFFGSLVPTFLLDKMGRRRPMMWGSAGLAFSMMMISVLLSFRFKRAEYSEATGKACAEASIAFFFVYMFIFGATANCIPWVYVPEILPLHARAKGTAGKHTIKTLYEKIRVLTNLQSVFPPTGSGTSSWS